MAAMTSHERFRRMFAHQDADRIPIIDSPWEATIERWQREGMPVDVSYVDYFGLDRFANLGLTDNSPRYPEQVISETETDITYTSSWGVTMRQWKHAASTPEFLDFTIVDGDTWRKAKERISPARDRVRWDLLKKQYRAWKEEGAWIAPTVWFGFDVTHSWMVGTERVLLALAEDPEWIVDMWRTELETELTLLDMVWDAGYTFDSIFWYDDMGYKQNQFFSLRMYRSLLKPFHQRAIDWAHAKGIKAHLHSCGDVRPFVPELVGMGLDALNPLEVKAGMDPVVLKQKFGSQLVFHGGVNAVLWDQPEVIQAEMEKVIPAMKENGGYIFSSDHSVPSSVSLEDFRRIVEQAKKLGSYQ
ncbi:MAG TPA: uroporphyrinogen decarboxylase family protein [Anaerolineaceae bacterium]